MKVVTVLIKIRRKAISPVIAAVLLIGIVVVGGALLSFLILPLLNPAPEFEIAEVSLVYDPIEARKRYHGVGEISLTVRQTGLAQVEINSISLYYAEPSVGATGTLLEINSDEDGDGAFIYSMNPYPSAESTQGITQVGTVFKIKFLLPDISTEKDLEYKVEVTAVGVSSPQSTDFGEESMNMVADKPEITSLNPDILSDTSFVRGNISVTPTITNRHGGIDNVDNVTYKLEYKGSQKGNLVTVGPPYKFPWNTDNGTYDDSAPEEYRITATVMNYAGGESSFVMDVGVDNDNEAPEIISTQIDTDTYDYSNGTFEPYPDISAGIIAEKGNITRIKVTVTDGGYDTDVSKFSSQITNVYVSYTKNTKTDWTGDNITGATELSNNYDGTWENPIPSSFIDSTANMSGKITFYIIAIDNSGNTNNTPSKYGTLLVEDNYGPDIYHTPVTSAYENQGIRIELNATDKDVGAEAVTLYYKKPSDPSYTTIIPMIHPNPDEAPSYFYYDISYNDATLDDLVYEVVAEDAAGQTFMQGPFYIDIPDRVNPTIIDHPIVSKAVDQTDKLFTVQVTDNDPNFKGISGTGTVEIVYRLSPSWGTPLVAKMNYTTGDLWEGTLLGGNFTYGSYGLDYYILITDADGNTAKSGSETVPYHVTVIQAGSPALTITTGVTLTDPTYSVDTNDGFKFTIRNAGTDDGTITHINLTFVGITRDLEEIQIDDPVNPPVQVWQDVWGGSGSSIELTATFTLHAGDTAEVEFMFDGTVDFGIYQINFTLDYPADPLHEVFNVDVSIPPPTYNLQYASDTVVGWRRDTLDVTFNNLGNPVTIDKITVSFTRGGTLEEIQIPVGQIRWSGSGTSGGTFDIIPDYTVPTGYGTLVVRLVFANRNIQGGTTAITFTTADGYTLAIPPFTN